MGLFDSVSDILTGNDSSIAPFNLQSAISSISSNLSQYVVTPLNAFGLGGFVFDIEGQSSNSITTEITDHFIEDNSVIQDHIGVKPVKITLKNYVGELVDRRDSSTNTLLQNVTQKLTVLNSYLPTLATAAQPVQDALSSNFSLADVSNLSASNITNTATNIWGFIQNVVPPTTRQEQAYQFFKALAQQKILVSLQTPFEFINNMAIESITAIQEEDSKYVSNFTITLKQIRFATTTTEPFNPSDYQPVTYNQTSDISQNGKLAGVDPSDVSGNEPIVEKSASSSDLTTGIINYPGFNYTP